MADYTSLYQGAGLASNIDPMLLRAIAEQESGEGQNTGPSSAGARGVMQFIPETASRYGVNVNDPKSSIYGAGRYMDDLLQYYGGDLHSALSAYGGDSGGKAGYANNVLARYQALQKPAASSGDQGGIKITMKPVATPSPFLPKSVPGADNYLAGSNIDEIEKHVGEPLSSVPDTKTDFAGALTGGASTTKAAPAAPASDKPDFAGALSPPPARAAPVSPEPVAGIPEAGQPSAAQPVPAAPTAPATAAATPQEIEGTPISQPAGPSWTQRNITDPWRQAYNPLVSDVPPMNYLLGSPTAQAALAGALQGPRDVARSATEFAQYANTNPTLAAIDRAAPQIPLPSAVGGGTVGGATPDQLAATANRLKAEQAQNERQYGSSLAYKAGNVVGDLFATIPFLGPVGKAAMSAAEYAPAVVQRAVPFVNTVLQGGGQNVMTSPDKAPGEAFSEGGAGALALHGILGAAGAKLASGPVRQAVQDADDLGFNLSMGDRYGGRAKQIEDVTRYTPGSGASALDAQYRARINTIINRNMGIDSPNLDQATLRQAADTSGRLMDQIKNVTINGNADATFQNELANLHQQAADRGITGITKQIDNIWDIMARPNNAGTFPGQSIQDLVGRGGTLDNMIRDGAPGEPLLAQQIKDAVYDAAQRSTSNPQAVRDFTNGRYIYKVMKTVEPLVNKTGELDDATYAGTARRITQQDFNQNGEMAKLQRVLSGPLAELKSSGTGRQLLTMRGLGLMSGEGGLGAGLAYLAPAGIDQVIAASAPWATSALLGRGLRFGPNLASEAGWPGATIGAVRQTFNPLLARVAGPTVATNPLLSNQGQQR